MLRRKRRASVSTRVPTSVSEVAELIAQARSDENRLWFLGSGTTTVPEGHTVVATSELKGIVDYKPDDLTVVVRCGTAIGELDQVLSEHGHTAVLPETTSDRTIGGVVASGASGYRRLRYGPTRDRVIGVTIVTGYGEVVRAGGQLVKNVTGYDLARLVTGSYGALGFIAEISLKLWPVPQGRTTVQVDDVSSARLGRYQPIAALETEGGGFLHISNPDVSDESFSWPAPLDEDIVLAINVPPRHVPDAVERIRMNGAGRFVAEHGVGVVKAGWSATPDDRVSELRQWAESVGGSLVIHRRGSLGDSVSRWGAEPKTPTIQRRLKQLFDPDRVCNPGVLPGGV